MTKEEFTGLIDKGYITDVTFVQQYMESPELAQLDVEALMDKYIACQIATPKTSAPAAPVKPKYTFTITCDTPGAVIKINSLTQSSIEVEEGTSVNWEVSAEGYDTQSGAHQVTKTETKPVTLVKTVVPEPTVQHTITFQVTPAEAKIDVDGQPLTGTTKTVDKGTTLNYRVYMDGYQEKTGSVVADSDKTEKVDLVANPPAAASVVGEPGVMSEPKATSTRSKKA